MFQRKSVGVFILKYLSIVQNQISVTLHSKIFLKYIKDKITLYFLFHVRKHNREMLLAYEHSSDQVMWLKSKLIQPMSVFNSPN